MESTQRGDNFINTSTNISEISSSNTSEQTDLTDDGDQRADEKKQLATIDIYRDTQAQYSRHSDSSDSLRQLAEAYHRIRNTTPIDHAWSKKILFLVGNKTRLMESFSWLSTVGGGFSALGERDDKFSARAGALSLGQQLKLAELLGDERLKVMCHLFAALAALQLDNKQFCINYIKRVILPLMNEMPYHDPILTNILRHICFRMSTLERFKSVRNAIEGSKSESYPEDKKN